MSEGIFQLKLKLSEGEGKQIGVLNDYIEFCKKWGRIETARETLFKKLHLVEGYLNMEHVEEVIREIKALELQSAEILKKSNK